MRPDDSVRTPFPPLVVGAESADSAWVLHLDPRRTKYVQYVVGATLIACGVPGILGAVAIGMSALSSALIVASILSIVAGVWWSAGDWPTRGQLIGFMVYADCSLTFGVMLKARELVSIPGTSLFAVTALLTVISMPLWMTAIHIAWSAATLAILVARAMAAHVEPTAMILSLAMVSATVFCSPTVLLIMMGELRSRARFALVDPLTGVANRRGLFAVFDTILNERTDAPFGTVVGLLMVDIDGFKQINDRGGHHEGDLALIRLARLLVTVGADCRTIARIGGDEFTCVLVGTLPEVRDSAVKISADLGRAREDCDISVSVGAAEASLDSLTARADALDDLLRRADAAMYQSKRVSPAGDAFGNRDEYRMGEGA